MRDTNSCFTIERLAFGLDILVGGNMNLFNSIHDITKARFEDEHDQYEMLI